MTLEKPKIPNARLHDGKFPATYTKAGARHQVDVSIGPSDSALNDAFGRLRVAEPFTIFDSKMLNDASPLFWDDQNVSGGGTSSTHNANQASATLAVSAATAGRRVRQTRRRFNYQPGKSLTVIMTGVLGAGTAGITRRVGLFDDQNGIFYQLSGTTLQLVRRTFVTGVAIDNTVDQSAWNIDKLDGAGPSGVTIDTTKTQIFFMDVEWLGVGRVRCGVYVDGLPIYVHQFVHANILTTVYMSTPNLPLRYEIQNDGTGAAASLTQICSTVLSEGGQDDTGFLRETDTGVTALAAAAIGTEYAMLGFRLKSTHRAISVNMIGQSILCGSPNDQFLWRWKLNPTVAGTFTYADITDSALQRAIGVAANGVTNGIAIAGGYGLSAAVVQSNLSSQLLIGSSIAGISDTLVLCVTPVTANASMYGACQWRELV